MNKLLVKVKGFLAYDFGVLEKRFYWKTAKYLNKYYNRHNDVKIVQDKTIIYMLDGRVYSGGISDVIKGILSMYKYSKEKGYNFKINFCYPYQLCDYLDSNLYNWKINENEISYDPNISVPLWMYSVHSTYGRSVEFESKYQLDLLNKFVERNSTKQQLHIYTNSEWINEDEYSLLFNELFKPSAQLERLLNHHRVNLSNEYISMTFRFQQLLGDFENKEAYVKDIQPFLEDIKINNRGHLSESQLRALLGDFKNKNISVPITDDNIKNKLIDDCIHKIKEIHSISFPEKKILITADSETFLREVRKLDFVYVVSAQNIFDGNENLSKDFKMFVKPFVDILMLSEANKLFLLCTGSMYRSGFAKNAALINKKDYEVVLF